MDIFEVDKNFALKEIDIEDIEFVSARDVENCLFGVYYDKITELYRRMPNDIAKSSGLKFVFGINITSAFLVTQVFAEDMINTGGNIINISSMNAYRPLTKIPAYSVAKAGLLDYLFDYEVSSDCPLWFIYECYRYWEKENEDNISKFNKKLIFNSKSLLYDKRVYDVDSALARTKRLNTVTSMIMMDIPCLYLIDEDGEKTDKCFTTDDLLSMDHYEMLEIMSKTKS